MTDLARFLQSIYW